MTDGSLQTKPAAVKRVSFVVPVFNDWDAFGILLTHLDRVSDELGLEASVIGVNDGSTVEMPADFGRSGGLRRLRSLEILDLNCNMGHQRALAVGLSEMAKRDDYDALVVMDADGEDDPNDVPRLLKAYGTGDRQLVLAQRISRSEGLVFTVFYEIYKLLYRLLTGYAISFGNYCVASPSVVRRLAYMSNMWNSLPATAMRSRVPYVLVPCHRGRRFVGQSHMNFVGLIQHGLQAISVFSDAAIVRLAGFVIAISVAAAAAVLYLRLFTDLAIRGWASMMLGFLLILVMQVLFILLTASLVTLRERGTMQMVPAVHGSVFVRGWRRLLPVA